MIIAGMVVGVVVFGLGLVIGYVVGTIHTINED